NFVGTISITPSGSGVSLPLFSTNVCRRWSFVPSKRSCKPISSASCSAQGFCVRNESGPHSITNGVSPSPSTYSVWILPPQRALCSSSTYGTPRFCSVHAALRPVMPPPTITTGLCSELRIISTRLHDYEYCTYIRQPPQSQPFSHRQNRLQLPGARFIPAFTGVGAHRDAPVIKSKWLLSAQK